MPPPLDLPGQHVADDAAHPAAGHQDAVSFPPDVVEIRQKPVVIRPVAELAAAGIVGVALQIMIRRVRQDQTRGFVSDWHRAGIAANGDLAGPVERRRPWVVAVEAIVSEQLFGRARIVRTCRKRWWLVVLDQDAS
jgi:hypothetical protein